MCESPRWIWVGAEMSARRVSLIFWVLLGRWDPTVPAAGISPDVMDFQGHTHTCTRSLMSRISTVSGLPTWSDVWNAASQKCLWWWWLWQIDIFHEYNTLVAKLRSTNYVNLTAVDQHPLFSWNDVIKKLQVMLCLLPLRIEYHNIHSRLAPCWIGWLPWGPAPAIPTPPSSHRPPTSARTR